MSQKLYPTYEEAKAEADRMNNERKRTSVEYVVGADRDWTRVPTRPFADGMSACALTIEKANEAA